VKTELTLTVVKSHSDTAVMKCVNRVITYCPSKKEKSDRHAKTEINCKAVEVFVRQKSTINLFG
jgi:hypothetical protein